MSLQLNGPNELVDGYKEFYGANNRQMPLLIGEGRTPLSAAGLMIRYLEVLRLHKNAPEELKPAYALLVSAWEDNYFDTGDGAARHSDGRMKVVPDAPYLRLLTPETRLVSGAVDLSDGYEALAGEEFSKANVDKYCGRPLSRRDAKKNPVWLALAGDKALLDELMNARFARAKGRFEYSRRNYGKLMGISAPPVPYYDIGAAGRLWTVRKLGDNSTGWVHLDFGDDPLGDYGDGRLVGVAQEAQRAATPPTLERRI